MPGPWELLIILVVVLLLFGGSRLAGLGKGVGRSIREFKEEVKSVEPGEEDGTVAPTPPPVADGGYTAPSPTAPTDPTEQR